MVTLPIPPKIIFPSESAPGIPHVPASLLITIAGSARTVVEQSEAKSTIKKIVCFISSPRKNLKEKFKRIKGILKDFRNQNLVNNFIAPFGRYLLNAGLRSMAGNSEGDLANLC
jgi:hypothetical protein